MRELLAPTHLILILVVLILTVLLVIGLIRIPNWAKRTSSTPEGPGPGKADPSLKLMLFGVTVLLFAVVLAVGGGSLHILGVLVGIVGLKIGITGLRG